MAQLTVDIDGMSCGQCVARVQPVLAAASDVKVDEVSVGNASLSCDPALSSLESIVGAVSNAGYPARYGASASAMARRTRCTTGLWR